MCLVQTSEDEIVEAQTQALFEARPNQDFQVLSQLDQPLDVVPV